MAENDPIFNMFFSPSPMSLVDASVFNNSKLTNSDLFCGNKSIMFVAPPRAGKSAAMSYGVLRDLAHRRLVVILTCQPSDNSYMKTTDNLKEQLSKLGLPRTVSFYTKEDVFDATKRCVSLWFDWFCSSWTDACNDSPPLQEDDGRKHKHQGAPCRAMPADAHHAPEPTPQTSVPVPQQHGPMDG